MIQITLTELGQLFENNFDCYTEVLTESGGFKEEMAMTKEKFIEVVSNYLKEVEDVTSEGNTNQASVVSHSCTDNNSNHQ
jgi:hypothetical protein